jgi:hypothetical protein
MESTQEQIKKTYQLMDSFGMLEKLSDNEKKIILMELKRIAAYAINDIKNIQGNELAQLYNETIKN